MLVLHSYCVYTHARTLPCNTNRTRSGTHEYTRSVTPLAVDQALAFSAGVSVCRKSSKYLYPMVTSSSSRFLLCDYFFSLSSDFVPFSRTKGCDSHQEKQTLVSFNLPQISYQISQKMSLKSFCSRLSLKSFFFGCLPGTLRLLLYNLCLYFHTLPFN